MDQKSERLKKGEKFITSAKGNSMSPKILSGQSHELSPIISWTECNINDIVYCKVFGNYYTHLVISKDLVRGLQIGNNKGRINGWTKNVYGKVTNIF